MRVLPLRENAWLVSSLRETCRARVLVGCVGFGFVLVSGEVPMYLYLCILWIATSKSPLLANRSTTSFLLYSSSLHTVSGVGWSRKV
jgi:hypothetical protein